MKRLAVKWEDTVGEAGDDGDGRQEDGWRAKGLEDGRGRLLVLDRPALDAA